MALYANFRGETLHAADFNGDGLTDLVREARIGGQMFPYLEVNTGAGFTSHFSALPLKAEDVRILPPADHNGDGHPDLIWHDRRTERINVLALRPEHRQARGPERRRPGGLPSRQEARPPVPGRRRRRRGGLPEALRRQRQGKAGDVRIQKRRPLPEAGLEHHQRLGAVTSVTHASLARTDHYERLDVQRTVVPTQFCHSFLGGSGCLPYGNPIDRSWRRLTRTATH